MVDIDSVTSIDKLESLIKRAESRIFTIELDDKLNEAITVADLVAWLSRFPQEARLMSSSEFVTASRRFARRSEGRPFVDYVEPYKAPIDVLGRTVAYSPSCNAVFIGYVGYMPADAVVTADSEDTIDGQG